MGNFPFNFDFPSENQNVTYVHSNDAIENRPNTGNEKLLERVVNGVRVELDLKSGNLLKSTN